MESGVGYSTASGVVFTREHPYQLVEEREAETLLESSRFRTAEPEELRAYYGYEIAT